jgi:hypothetical protein
MLSETAPHKGREPEPTTRSLKASNNSAKQKKFFEKQHLKKRFLRREKK